MKLGTAFPFTLCSISYTQKPVRTEGQTQQCYYKMIPFFLALIQPIPVLFFLPAAFAHTQLPQPEARNVQTGSMPFPAESQALHPPPAKAGNKTRDLSQFLRCGLSPSTHICPLRLSQGQACPPAGGVCRTLIQPFTFNMDIRKTDSSSKSLASMLHWDTQEHKRLCKGNPGPVGSSETALRSHVA